MKQLSVSAVLAFLLSALAIPSSSYASPTSVPIGCATNSSIEFPRIVVTNNTSKTLKNNTGIITHLLNENGSVFKYGGMKLTADLKPGKSAEGDSNEGHRPCKAWFLVP